MGVIQKKSRRQRISIGMKKGNLYNLNKIFMPIFNMSYRTRGGFNYVLKNPCSSHCSVIRIKEMMKRKQMMDSGR